MEELAVTAAHASVTIEAAVPAHTLRADGDMLARVLANLVDNAVRHSPESGKIAVTAAATAQGIEIRVCDQGSGVPVAERERIFERFVGGGASSTRSNRGLGLAFCKLAVEAHGGRIWIEDNAPGAAFCLTIP